MTAQIKGYAVLAIARLHTLGYEARPSAWMQDVGCELDTELAATVLLEHYFDRRYGWLPSFLAWLIADDRYGCITMTSDETKPALRALADRIREGGHGSAMLNAVSPVMRKLDSVEGIENHALLTAICLAKTAMELVREARVATLDEVKEPFAKAMSALVMANTLANYAAPTFADEFKQAMADTIERLLYPHRDGLTRRPGNCQTARMLREQRSDN